MSAKNTAVNVLILTTFVSFLLYLRAGRVPKPVVSWAKMADRLIECCDLSSSPPIYVLFLGSLRLLRRGLGSHRVLGLHGSSTVLGAMVVDRLLPSTFFCPAGRGNHAEERAPLGEDAGRCRSTR